MVVRGLQEAHPDAEGIAALFGQGLIRRRVHRKRSVPRLGRGAWCGRAGSGRIAPAGARGFRGDGRPGVSQSAAGGGSAPRHLGAGLGGTYTPREYPPAIATTTTTATTTATAMAMAMATAPAHVKANAAANANAPPRTRTRSRMEPQWPHRAPGRDSQASAHVKANALTRRTPPRTRTRSRAPPHTPGGIVPSARAIAMGPPPDSQCGDGYDRIQGHRLL